MPQAIKWEVTIQLLLALLFSSLLEQKIFLTSLRNPGAE